MLCNCYIIFKRTAFRRLCTANQKNNISVTICSHDLGHNKFPLRKIQSMGSKYFFLLLTFISISTFAQTGKITGKVINSASGQALSGASLILVEKSTLKVADQNGAFSFNKLTAGVYSVKCSYSGFNEKVIVEIGVKDNENTDITIALDIKAFGGVVVAAKRIKAAGETVASLLVAQKNSASVSDGVTAETIKKTPDKSSSDVIKRVSGASIQDDKFAIIRGLNDRYNAAFINGAPLPSTESDRKAFAFDIFPSAILDNLVIFKTATPDKPGEFAGGLIEITTKSAAPKNFTSITFGQGFNTTITGKQRYYAEVKGTKDWLGLDDGRRGLPQGLPSTKEIQAMTFDQRLHAAKYYENFKWGIRHTTATPNFNFQLSKGFNIQRHENEFIAAIFSLNYNKSYTLAGGERNAFDPRAGTNDKTTAAPVLRGKFRDSVYNEEIVWAALANISIKINNANSISWKNNLSVNSDNKLIKRMGNIDYSSDSTNFIQDKVRSFTSDQIVTSQLVGDHQIGANKIKINWLAAYTRVDRIVPNVLLTSYGFDPIKNILLGANVVGPNYTNWNGGGSMFSSKSAEEIKNAKMDIVQSFNAIKSTLKIGFGYQERNRNFTSRNLGLSVYGPGTYAFDQSIKNLPEDQIFLGQFLGLQANGKAGFTLAENTDPNSAYEAASTIAHAYLMNDQRILKKIRLIYGVRVEKFNQKLNALKSNADAPINLNNTVTDYLPSINFIYSPTAKANIRLSYAETVNRPEFRELAPFLFRDYTTGYTVNGDDKLVRAQIGNYDFRYEYFPGKAQLLSFSAFYKSFTNPIELILVPDAGGDNIGYSNTSKGYLYGFEAEFRVLLSTLIGQKDAQGLLSKLTLTGNGAYLKSEVKAVGSRFIPAAKFGAPRLLQGQSPYIINGSLGYTEDKLGLSSTISVNKIGDRLIVGGNYEKADIYEKGRTVVDFQIAKSCLNNKVELKFNARDILAQSITTYYDFERSATFKANSNDRVLTAYRAPQSFTFTASIKF